MNILSTLVLFVILLKCVVASGDTVGVVFNEAVDEENVEWLRANEDSWWERKDLLDYVIERGVAVTVKFIQRVDGAKGCVYLLDSLTRETMG